MTNKCVNQFLNDPSPQMLMDMLREFKCPTDECAACPFKRTRNHSGGESMDADLCSITHPIAKMTGKIVRVCFNGTIADECLNEISEDLDKINIAVIYTQIMEALTIAEEKS